MPSKVWKTSDDGKFIFVSPNAENLEDCLEVIRKAFFTDENTSKAVEIRKDPEAMKELEELTLRAIGDGVTVIAVEKETGKVIAGAFNKIQVPGKSGEDNFFEIFEKKCKRPSSKGFVRLMIDADAERDIFEFLDVDCLLEVMFLATLPQYRGLGIGKTLVGISISGENVKQSITGNLNLEPVPKAISAICTTFITKRITDSCGFKTASEINFDRWSFNGKPFSETIGPENPKVTTVCYKI